MSELVNEVGVLLSRPLIGSDWAKLLFWDLLDCDRVSRPVTDDVLPPSFRGGLSEAMLWATRDDMHVVLVSAAPGTDLGMESQAAIAGRIGRSWRRVLLLFGDYEGRSWDLVVGVPRMAGRRPLFRRIQGLGRSRTKEVATHLAGLAHEQSVVRKRALTALYRSGEPLADPVEMVFHGLPRALRTQLRGTPFETFVREAATHSLLTRAEEHELGHRIRSGDVAAEHELILHNIRFGIWGARRHWRRLEFEDLVQHAMMGIMRAARKFDPEYGGRFSTYAYHWVRQACTRAWEVDSTLIRLPTHVRRPVEAYRRRRTRGGCGSERPEDAEFERLLRLSSVEPLTTYSAVVGEESDEATDPSCLAVRSILQADRWACIEGVLLDVSERDREILYRRYGLKGRGEQTLEEIGVALGITRERVRQVQQRVIELLRSRLLKDNHDLFEDCVAEASRSDEMAEQEQESVVEEPVAVECLQLRSWTPSSQLKLFGQVQ